MALLQLDDLMAGPRPAANKPDKIEVTPSAVERVKQILAGQPEKANQGLRVYVANGGCAGYSYGMSFDDPSEGDTIMDYDGLKVMLAPDSVPWLKGARVDYVESMLGSGFSITNPNASSGCGCGHSFSKGDDAPAESGAHRH